MTTRAPIRQLQQHASELIDRVVAGERVEITRNGRLIAVLGPPPPEQRVTTDPILRAAGQFPARHLRSLDAIHLASAEHLEQALTAFVSYDKRLAAAARKRDLPVESPA